MAGLLGNMQMLPQDQQQPFDQNAFNQAMQMAAQQSMAGEDQISRMSRLAAEQQAQNTLPQQQGWWNPDAFANDPQTNQPSEYVPAAERYNQTVRLNDEKGNPYDSTFMPMGLTNPMSRTPQEINPNWMRDAERGYQQYGPGFLAGIF